jgi:uncharacterized membrane protein
LIKKQKCKVVNNAEVDDLQQNYSAYWNSYSEQFTRALDLAELSSLEDFQSHFGDINNIE